MLHPGRCKFKPHLLPQAGIYQLLLSTLRLPTCCPGHQPSTHTLDSRIKDELQGTGWVNARWCHYKIYLPSPQQAWPYYQASPWKPINLIETKNQCTLLFPHSFPLVSFWVSPTSVSQLCQLMSNIPMDCVISSKLSSFFPVTLVCPSVVSDHLFAPSSWWTLTSRWPGFTTMASPVTAPGVSGGQPVVI